MINISEIAILKLLDADIKNQRYYQNIITQLPVEIESNRMYAWNGKRCLRTLAFLGLVPDISMVLVLAFMKTEG